jgi:hypothetical protein
LYQDDVLSCASLCLLLPCLGSGAGGDLLGGGCGDNRLVDVFPVFNEWLASFKLPAYTPL